jgi:Sulfotransferase family
VAVEQALLAEGQPSRETRNWRISLGQSAENLARYLKRAQFVLAPNPYGATGILRARFSDAVFMSLKRRYLFASNEKVGNSTLRTTFQTLEAGGHLPPGYQRFKRWTGPLLQPSDVRNFSYDLTDKTIRKFCVVRHPYARLVSCYRNKFEESGPKRRGYRRAMRDLGLSPRQESISFAEFVYAVADQPHTVMNAHWRVQFFNTFMDLISYDEIIRLEHLDERLPSLIEEFYPERANDPSSAVIQYKRSPKPSELLIDQYFNAELKAIVREAYRLDFQTFGYAP